MIWTLIASLSNNSPQLGKILVFQNTPIGFWFTRRVTIFRGHTCVIGMPPNYLPLQTLIRSISTLLTAVLSWRHEVSLLGYLRLYQPPSTSHPLIQLSPGHRMKWVPKDGQLQRWQSLCCKLLEDCAVWHYHEIWFLVHQVNLISLITCASVKAHEARGHRSNPPLYEGKSILIMLCP